MKNTIMYTAIVAALSCIPAYFTHLYWTVTTLLGDGDMQIKDLALAIVGIIFPPIGVVHGFIIWF